MLSNGSVYMDDVDERVSCTCEVYERVSWMFGMNKSRHNMTVQPMFPLTMQRKLAAMVPLSLFNLKVLDENCRTSPLRIGYPTKYDIIGM